MRARTTTRVADATRPLADLIQVNALVPALLAGNTVLLKPSPQTPLCSERILAHLLAAGLPKDVCQVRPPAAFCDPKLTCSA